MSEPITLADAKVQLRLGAAASPEDGLIGSLITTAREAVETYTGHILTRRAVTETAGGFGRWIDLRAWPVVSVDAIEWLDGAGTTQALAAWRVNLDRRPIRLLPVRPGWGVTGGLAIDAVLPVTIHVTAGYAAGDVPERFRQAMRIIVAHLYEFRGGDDAGKVDEMPPTARGLIQRDRLRRV